MYVFILKAVLPGVDRHRTDPSLMGSGLALLHFFSHMGSGLALVRFYQKSGSFQGQKGNNARPDP
jgi:hypothetical protein